MARARVLITGGSGYLAGSIASRLRQSCDLTLMDRVEPPADRSDLPFSRGDITSFDDVRAACRDQDAVVHTVALVRERFGKPHGLFADVMVKGTWNVAEACAQQGVRRIVHISSVIASGTPARSDHPYAVGDPCVYAPGDLFYCLAKRLAEQVLDASAQAHGFRVIHLRPGIIAGDGLNREPAKPAGDPRYWFMHVDPRDVAQAVELALVSDLTSGCYHIVAGRADSRYEWESATRDLGYTPEHNWKHIPVSEVNP
ncbi:NAD(P)-dependent oxidoreductase [Candidatus Poribacteria bacterium]|nr:NAD(P)-dependent oxidoreductase [Candidatus Poribacteria bacterium]